MQPTLTELLLSGGQLMLIGMGIVFLFLALLVWVIGAAANWFARDLPDEESAAVRPFPLLPEEPDESEAVAAICVAIHRYRER